ncbi:MAG: peptidase S41, partial [Porphyromonadaceae bacterium]|nr:peptidase S41 [Porphyromonadaceae bacterium]
MRLLHRASLALLSLACILPLSAQRRGAQPKQDNKYNYMQAIDVLGSSMALLDRYFVDSVDLKQLSRLGLASMLESLDPYTEYYSAEDNDKLRLMTTGEY